MGFISAACGRRSKKGGAGRERAADAAILLSHTAVNELPRFKQREHVMENFRYGLSSSIEM